MTTSQVADSPRRSRPGLRVLDLQDVGEHVVQVQGGDAGEEHAGVGAGGG